MQLNDIISNIRRSPYCNQYKNNKYMWTLNPPRTCKLLINDLIVKIPNISRIRIHPNRDLLILILTIDIDYGRDNIIYKLPFEGIMNFEIKFEQKKINW